MSSRGAGIHDSQIVCVSTDFVEFAKQINLVEILASTLLTYCHVSISERSEHYIHVLYLVFVVDVRDNNDHGICVTSGLKSC